MKTPSKKIIDLWDMCITISWSVPYHVKYEYIVDLLGEDEQNPFLLREEWEINFIFAKTKMYNWMRDMGYSYKQLDRMLDYVNEI